MTAPAVAKDVIAGAIADTVGDHIRDNAEDLELPDLADFGLYEGGESAWFEFADGTRATITITIEPPVPS